jgi:uncharacterized membrane protein
MVRCPGHILALIALVLMAFFIWATPSAARAATFEPLGFLNATAPGSFAQGVSADGSAVVGYSYNVNLFVQYDQGVEWKNGAAIQLKNFANGGYLSNTDGSAISGDGSTIAGTGHLTGSSTSQGLVLHNGLLTTIAPLPGFSATSVFPTAASGDGTAVVGEDYGNSMREAFLWQNGEATTLGSLPGAASPAGAANGISADASVIVGEADNAIGNQQAFRWLSSGVGSGTMSALPFLPGETASVALAVSADGQVAVGQGSANVLGVPTTSVMWTNGTVTDLGLPSGANFGQANSVSGDGAVVVGFNNFAAGGTRGQQSYIWTEQTGMVDLKGFLIARGATGLSGWTLWDATGISSDGKTIVGIGYDPQNHFQAFVATIPEPSSIFLAVVGSLALLAWGKYARKT